MCRRGFTLIELLVVIAIITILAAILFPVFITSRESSKMRSCASNLRQLGSAFKMYCDDYSGLAIPERSTGVRPWPELITRYSKGAPTPSVSGGQLRESGTGTVFINGTSKVYSDNPKRPWICPGDRDGLESYSNGCPKPAAWKRNGTTYNMFYCQTVPDGPPARPDMWAKPSRDYLMADGWFYYHYGRRQPDDGGGNVLGNGQEANKLKILNVLMMDGRVRPGSRLDQVSWYDGALRNSVVYDNPYNTTAQFDDRPKYPPGTRERYCPAKGKD